MYNYNRLRGCIREFCGTHVIYAGRLGISISALYSKLNGKTLFSQDEIAKSIEMFDLQNRDVIKTFFTKKEEGKDELED